MLVFCAKKGFVVLRGRPLEQFYSGLPRTSSSLYHTYCASQRESNSMMGENISNMTLLHCTRCAAVLSSRALSLSSSDLKKPGIPSSHNQSKSMLKFTRKFLDGGMEEPPLIYNTVTGRSDASFKKTFIGSGTSPRRLQVLNKLFFDHIREIISSGMFEDHLDGCNFHVTKIRVLEDLMGVHVYYLQTGSDPEPSQELLKNVGRMVRKELHNLALISRIPPITFIKDRSFENVLEVERRLAIIAQADELQQQNGELEAVNQLRLASPAVPDAIFEDDFKYDPSSPLNFAAAAAQLPNPKNKPRSRFTPFAPRFSYKREQHPPNVTWNRPVREEWAGAAPSRTVPRQVPLATNTFNLNRNAVMSRVERGLSRVSVFKKDGIDINVYEANMLDLSLERKLLEGDDLEQQQRWEPVLEIMPRSSLQRWAADYSRKHGKGLSRERRKPTKELTAGEPALSSPQDMDFEDVKYYEIEDELQVRTDAPDYYEEDSWR